MITQALSLWRSVEARIRLSPREIALVAILAAALAIFVAVASIEQAAALREQAVEAHLARASIARLVAAERSRSFHRAIGREADKVRRWSLAEPTVHIARVRAETDLAQLAQAAGINDVRVAADRSSAPRRPVDALVLTIEGEFTWASFRRLLARLVTAVPVVSPVAVEVEPPAETGFMFTATSAPPRGRFRLKVIMPYLPDMQR